MVASIRCKAILLAVLPVGLCMAQIGPSGGGGSGSGSAGPTGPAGPAPPGTGAVVVNSGVPSAVTVSGDGALNPATGALTVTKSNGSSFAAVATSGSASDLGIGTLPHGRLPVLLSADIPANTANTTGNAVTATALAGTPALCPAGSYTLGISPTGSARNCTVLPSFPVGTVVGTTDLQVLTNKSIDGSEIVSGTLPHARLPALLTGDIPSNAANTTGNAATATALANIPTLCTTGQAPTGITANGNATGCAAAGGGSTAVAISTSGAVADPGGASNFQVNNAAGAITFNLAAGVAGNQRCYRNATAVTGAITIAVTTGNNIDFNGINGTAGTGTLVSSGALGDAVCLISDTTNHWYASVSSGTWTNN